MIWICKFNPSQMIVCLLFHLWMPISIFCWLFNLQILSCTSSYKHIGDSCWTRGEQAKLTPLPKGRLKCRPNSYGLCASFLSQHILQIVQEGPQDVGLRKNGRDLEGLGWELDLSGDLDWWLGGRRSEVTPETGAHGLSIHKALLSQSNLTSFHFPPFHYQKITRAKCLEMLPESASVIFSKGHHQSVTTPIK